jgi:PIN domain nuclease of toxin-antitoxin system
VSLLLDTHVFFWWMVQDPRLAVFHRTLLEDDANDIYVSAVTGWEIAIKVKLGKWPEAQPLLPDLKTKIFAAGFDIAPVTLAQAEHAGSLSLAHRDPFDRMLAAQAIDLNLSLATSDSVIAILGCRIV